MNSDILTVQPNESFDEYRLRIYKYKQYGQLNLNWTEIAQLFNETFGILRDESKWRKEAKELLISNIENVPSAEDSIKADLSELILEYKKERVKLSDERVQNNAYIRQLSREETLIEIAQLVSKEMSSKKILNVNFPRKMTNSVNEAIVMASDWHYGIEINNFLNTFDPEVCVYRINKYLDEIKQYLSKNPVKKIHFVNLGDLIAGRIHSTLRLQSRFDVITQCLHIAEIMAEFLLELSKICDVEYYDCLDNHSRLEPDKKESLDLESLVRVIPWFLKYRFEGNEHIHINDNELNEDIIAFTVMDGRYTIGGVHGHKDRPGKVVDNLTLLTKVNFDMILTAHLHHFSADEKNETLVVSNGSLMGTDKYAMDLRLSSKPSQNILLVSENSVLDDIHRVVLN